MKSSFLPNGVDRSSNRIAGTLGAGFVAIALLSSSAVAQYRLFPGDALEVSASGIPELRHRAQINVDGEASFPLIGEIAVAGLTLPEVREKLQTLIPAQQLRRQTPDGREFPVIVTPREISVSIAEYRPVYLNGDVSKPGEQVFRPGLTIRQAIALAGGYDVARFRMNNPFLEQADLTSEYQTLWAEFAKTQVLVTRLRAELAGKARLDSSGLSQTPLPAPLARDIAAVETDRMDVRVADLEKEKAYLRRAVAQEEYRVTTLSEQQRQEKEGTRYDSEDLKRTQELFKTGNVPITRVAEARRSVLLSSTRELQTTVLLAQIERERGELQRKLERTDDQRRMELLTELQEANVRLGGLRARLEGVGEKLTYTGLIRSQLVRGKSKEPELIIFRTSANGRVRLADQKEDAELQPGDIVEVSLQALVKPLVPAE